MAEIRMWLDIIPPTSTAQMKKVRVVGGRAIFYEPEKVKAARRVLMEALRPYAPPGPLEGALSLTVEWIFRGTRHKDGEWRTTRPDTDNLEKLLKDCMTDCGYWNDDAQVAVEKITKKWGDKPGIMIAIKSLD